MNRLSKNKIFNVLFKIVFIILLAKAVAVVSLAFLPSEPFYNMESSKKSTVYRHLNFKNMIKQDKKQKKQASQNRSNGLDMKSFILKGLYGNDKYGYAIVAKKSNPKKTTLVGLGEIYNGYKLKNILLDRVVFVKNNKEYILRLEGIDSRIKKSIQIVKGNTNDEIPVAKRDIEYYSKHPNQIWREISITEIKKLGKIVGFKVTKIKQGSKLSKLGLKAGDVILKVNGTPLHSYQDAIKVYSDIDNLDFLSLVIKRGNEEKEIIYEVN